MSKEVIVESFELDHTIVKAPYVRLIGEEIGPKGDVISNFDIRLVQPNEDSIPTAGLHTIEHLLAKLIRTRIDGMIDCSPFGCRTGFHMIMWGQHTSAEIAAVIKDSLSKKLLKPLLGKMFLEQPSNLAETTRTTASFLLRNGRSSSWNKESQMMPLSVMSSKHKRNQLFS